WAPVPLDGTPSGLDGAVYALASAGGVLHVGGDFSETTNSAFSPDWAVYTCGCYGNCDGSAAAPVLNVADFTCFLTKYAAGDPYANCDSSTAEPTLNVGD